VFLFLLASVQAAEKSQCRTFKEIYVTGKAMCENMWIGAFKFEPDPTKAYTMWFFDETNPNGALTDTLDLRWKPPGLACAWEQCTRTGRSRGTSAHGESIEVRFISSNNEPYSIP
jgi:hypothetical protein